MWLGDQVWRRQTQVIRWADSGVVRSRGCQGLDVSTPTTSVQTPSSSGTPPSLTFLFPFTCSLGLEGVTAIHYPGPAPGATTPG